MPKSVLRRRLLAHFGKHGASATVRPEGVDDLELSWRDSEGTILTQFVQVKKPREDRATNPTNLPWTLPDITRDLIPGAFAHLKGNCWHQDWVLGDNLSSDALQLLDAGKYAPAQKPELYWSTVHLLARHATLSSRLLDPSTRKAVINWKLSPELSLDYQFRNIPLDERFRTRTGVADFYLDGGNV